MKTLRVFVVVLIAALLAPACSSDEGSSGGSAESFEVKLRRIEVAEPGMNELGLTIIALVSNPGSSPVIIEGGDVKVRFAGRPERLADAPAAEAEGDDDEEEEEEPEDTSFDDTDTDSPDLTDEAEGEYGDEEEGAAPAAAEEEAAAEPIDLDPTGIVADVWAEGSTTGGKVPAGAEAELPYTVTLPMPEDPEALRRLLSWEIVDVEAKGTVRAKGAIESFQGTREIRLPVLPIVELEPQIGRVDGGREGQVFFHLKIYNPNAFELEIDRLAYSIKLADKVLKPLDEGAPDTIPAGAERPIDESIKLNDETWGPGLQQVLQQPSVPYEFRGVMVIQGMELPIDYSGVMEFPR